MNTDDNKSTTRYEAVDIDVRGLRYRVHCWGSPRSTPVLLLHGWADTGLSFQFLAQHLSGQWYLLAPDWRGFGDSDHCAGGYWFPDYLADLDVLIDAFGSGAPVRLAGHSMGGNVAWLYAGAAPERVSHAVSLDAFGLPETDPSAAPDRYRSWLGQVKRAPEFTRYDSMEDLCRRIAALAPNATADRVRRIAESWITGDGTLMLKADPRHKRVNPVLYRRAEALACWRRISARTLLVLGTASRFHEQYFRDGYREECRKCMPALEEAVVEDAGHMLHWEQPERVARIIGEFLNPPDERAAVEKRYGYCFSTT